MFTFLAVVVAVWATLTIKDYIQDVFEFGTAMADSALYYIKSAPVEFALDVWAVFVKRGY